MLVRLGLEDEAEEIVDMTILNVTETRSEHVVVPDVVRATYQSYLDRANPVFYVAEHQRRVVGFVMYSVCRYRFTHGQFMAQEVLFVRPEFRGTRAAVLLMKQLIADAERLEIREIVGGNDNSFNSDRTRRFLEHFGFKMVGYSMRRLSDGLV